MKTSSPAFTFVFPNVLNGRFFDGFDFHLGTGYIRAYLAQRDIASQQFISEGSYSIDEAAGEILGARPMMVGLSCYDLNYHLVRTLAKALKKQAPDVLVVLGGPTATFSDQLIMSDCDAFDICARSYAEETSLDLVRWQKHSAALADIPGITYRQNGQIVRNKDRSMPARSARLAPQPDGLRSGQPSFEDIGGALDVYPDPYVTGFIPPKRVSDVGLITSRGCTFACTFCNFSAMSGRSFATHSLDHQLSVFDFLDQSLVGPGRTLVTINDDNFSLQGKRFHELLRRMTARNYANLSFWAEMRAEPMNDESFELLKGAGFGEINFGLESGSPKVLAAMKKVRSSGWHRDEYAKEKVFLERIAWAVKRSRETGIRTTVSIIIGAPDESADEGQATLQFVERLGVDTYAHNFLGIGDGTELAATYADWRIDVTYPADRVLPPVTTLPYDVYQLKILNHDRAWLAMTGLELRQASFLFTGVGHLPVSATRPRSFGRGGRGRVEEGDLPLISDGSGSVISIDEDAADAETAAWLARIMSLDMSVWLVRRKLDSKRKSQALLNEAGVPIPELNDLREIQIENTKLAFRVNEFSSSAPSYNTRVLRVAAPGAPRSLPDQSDPDTREAVVFSIDDAEELATVLGMASDGTATEFKLDRRMIMARAAFEDTCRWCSGSCPATKLDRLLISDTKSIRPCQNGNSVGLVGDSLETLQHRLDALTEAERDKRGCATCSAKASCSQCLFPYPSTVEEYCDIQRNRPALRAFFDGLVLVRGLLDSRLLDPQSDDLTITSLCLVREGSIETPRGPVPLSACVLLGSNQDGALAFIYSQRYQFVAEIPPVGYMALRLLARQARQAMAILDGGPSIGSGEHPAFAP